MIFVGHSLGGIVIKSALIFSSESTLKSTQAIELSTCGVIFFGTPHRGSEAAMWGEMVQDIANLTIEKPNSKLLETLEIDSRELEYQLQRFKALKGDFQTSFTSLNLLQLLDVITMYVDL